MLILAVAVRNHERAGVSRRACSDLYLFRGCPIPNFMFQGRGLHQGNMKQRQPVKKCMNEYYSRIEVACG